MTLLLPLAAFGEACSEPKKNSKSSAMDSALLDAQRPPDATALDAQRRDAAKGQEKKDSGKPDANMAAQDAGLHARTSAHVLFSGHSLMDNPVPNWVESIAHARGDELGWEEQIVIGSPLRARTRGEDEGASDFSGYAQGKRKDGGSVDVLAELAHPTALSAKEHYDTLVVTDRHDILDVIQWEGTIPYLRHFHDRLREHSPGASTLFYQSWWSLNKNASQAWVDFQAIELVAWECVAAKVNASLEAEGLPTNVAVLPTGLALSVLVKRVLNDEVPGFTGSAPQKLDLIFEDNVHLAPYGQYFAAAVTYAGVFDKSPVGAHAVTEVPAATAPALEEIAWQVVSDYARERRARSRRDLGECREEIASKVCPAYAAIHGNASANCDAWRSADGRFSWPD